MNVTALVQSVSKASGNLMVAASDEMVGFAKGNITEHLTTLLSTPRNQGVVEAVGFLADYVKLPLAAADAAERCAWSALAKLTSTNSIASIGGGNPLDYVPSTYDGLKYCLYEQAAKNNIGLNWFLIMVILVIIMTVLFGPFWAVLVPLRMLGFGALGVMPASVAAMLQSVFHGGHTPAGGWFATFTRWGMTAMRGFW